jgi:hypothetical protein
VSAPFNITIPNQGEKKYTPFPNAGDTVCLIFPKSAYTQPGEKPDDERWLGTIVNLPLNLDEFNMAVLVPWPDGSKITVRNIEEKTFFEFSSLLSSQEMEQYIASLMYRLYVPPSNPNFVETILGRRNYGTPPELPIRAKMNAESGSLSSLDN